MCIPGLLYVMQNSLQLLAIKVPNALLTHRTARTHRPLRLPHSLTPRISVALSLRQYLDASAFSILSQLKILTTAVCSVLMLGTHLSLRKWRALGLLVIGAILVQFPDASTTTKANESRTSVTGLAAVLGMVCISGLAGIYLEKYLKNKAAPTASSNSSTTPSIPQATLWERNLQLSLYGMLFALASVWYSDRDVLAAQGFFTGYSMWTWLVIVSAAGGGLIVAVVVKYTNTIVKGFATSISIIVTSVVSLVLFPEVRLSLLFWLGTACVLISIFNYNEEDPVVKAKVQDTPQLNGKAGSNGYKRMMEEELMGARLLHDSGAEEEGLDGPQSSLLRSATSPSHR